MPIPVAIYFVTSLCQKRIITYCSKCTAYVTVVAFKRSEEKEALKITYTFQRKTVEKEWEFMIREYRRERERERERERD